MTRMDDLFDYTRPRRKSKRVGRGVGSGKGKTCGRGHKGMGARAGCKRRYTYEGGQFRLFMKLPQRGFSNVKFQQRYHTINLGKINQLFEDGDVVNLETLALKGYLSGKTYGIKILGDGELTKQVSIEADAISESAREKLQQAKISFALSTF